MRAPRRCILVAVAALSTASIPASGFSFAHSGIAGIALPILRFSLAHRSDDQRPVIDREHGRRFLEFPVGEPAAALFVNLSGRVQFERADIGFADGTVESVDAFGLDRDSGLYELAHYAAPRSVAFVRLILRARSRQARVGICIGV